MADVTESSVSVEIVVDANVESAKGKLTEVQGSVDSLKDSVTALSTALSGLNGFNGSGLADVAKAFTALSSSASDVKNIGANVSGLSDGILGLSVLTDEDISGSAYTLESIATSMGKLSSVDSAGIGKLAMAMGDITGAVERLSDSGITSMLPSLQTNLDGVASAATNAAQVGPNMAKLGSGVKDLAKGLESFTQNNYSEGITSFGGALEEVMEHVSYLEDSAGTIKNFSQLGAGIKGLAKGLETFGASEGYGAGINVFGAALKGITAELQTLASAGESIKTLGQLTRNIAALASVGQDAQGLAASLGAVSGAVSGFVTGITSSVPDDQAQKFVALAQAIEQVAQSYGNLNAAQRAVSGVSEQTASAVASEVSPFAALGTKALQLAQTIGGKLASALKKAASHLGSFAKNLAMTPFNNIKAKIDGITSAFSKLSGTIGRIVLYRALRGVLSSITSGMAEGIKNLYEWAMLTGNSFVATMDSMATSVNYFKNSVAAAASNLLDAWAPALDALIDYVVAAINAINQLLAALGGSGVWRKAVKTTQAYGAAADSAAGSAGNAAKAVEEYKNTVLGFDELNKLNDVNEPNGGSGGGGGGGGGGAAGELAFVEEEIADFWKDLANTDDWTALGELIANNINSWMYSIDWDAIDATAEMWSKRVYTSFNGFVGALDWSEVGYTLGRGINVALHFVDDIAQNADWTEFGTGLARSLNSLVSTLDWEALGRVLTDGLKVSLETLHGFIARFSWNDLRDGLSAGIDSAFANIDWETALNDVTKGIGEIAVTVASVAGDVFSNLADTLSDIDWSKWGKKVASYLNKAIGEMDWEALGRTLLGIVGAAIDALVSFLVNLDWASVGGAIVNLLKGAIEGAADSEVLSDAFKALFTTSFDPDVFISGWSVDGWAHGFIDFFTNVAESVISTIKNWLIDRVIDFLEELKNIPGVSDILGDTIDQAISGLEGLKDKFEKAGSDIGTSIKDGLFNSGVNESAEDAIKNVADTALKAATSLSDVMRSSGATLFNNVKSGMNNTTEANKVGQGIANYYASGITSKASASKSAGGKLLSNAKAGMYNANSAKSWGQSMANNFASGVSSKAGNVKNQSRKVYNSVSGQLSSSNAYTWGRHIPERMAAGINATNYKARNAAANVAANIKRFLGFSEPEEGPLSNFHTYMPDMLQLMADGIRSESDLVLNELDRLAENMRNAIPNEMSTDVALSGRYDLSDVNATMASAVAMGTVGLSNPATSNRPVELVLRVDGRELARATYSNLDALRTGGYVDTEFV